MNNETTKKNYQLIEGTVHPVKAWVNGVEFEEGARKQVQYLADMPFVFKHVAVMPDVHAGIGATVGSVIATKSAIIPAAVGVDIGCGMAAVKTSLKAKDLPTSLSQMRDAIERAVPHGRTDNGGPNDHGAWGNPPGVVLNAWHQLTDRFEKILDKHPAITRGKKTDPRPFKQLGSLGTGNHFIEVCLDTEQNVWVMLHSGSRGIGNSIGSYFISQAKEEMKKNHIHLVDHNLAYLSEGSSMFNDYCEAVEWAQDYASSNREVMMKRVLEAMKGIKGIPGFQARVEAVNCHHNYVSKETHFGEEVLVTRKGAVRADKGMMGIIPGSMGAKSYIVRGKGNEDAFCSCSHGAGRRMSRTEAKETISVADHVKATEGVECRKDSSVVDESPAAYKSIDDVMAAQTDLVEVVATLKQVLCVKG
jgi:tRNA-splicing ligase RtcB (3'-phosphate/5'-hydroxy nucleic acid ligase)